jgi:acyl-coenzyme A thioesterase PaaI-like protein
VPDAYFRLTAEHDDRSILAADPGTAGPWQPGLQHGGPPSALLVRAAERFAAREAQPGLIAMRLAAEFVGAVPVGEVEVTARLVRSARSAALVEATLIAQDRICLQGRVWLVRPRDTAGLAAELPPPSEPPSGLPGLGTHFPYGDTIDWQFVTGSLVTPGPGAAWARPLRTLVPDEPLSGLQRVALVGDSASGISAELDWSRWSFLNVDLDVHLARPVDGDWVLIDAVTQLGGQGAALARSTVSDLRGVVGTTAQTLVLSPR